MLRTSITIENTRFFLAQGTDPAALEREMVDAVRSGGDFVRFTEVGNRSVRVLVSPGVSVIFQTTEVPDDARDSGDVNAPFAVPEEAGRHLVQYEYGID